MPRCRWGVHVLLRVGCAAVHVHGRHWRSDGRRLLPLQRQGHAAAPPVRFHHKLVLTCVFSSDFAAPWRGCWAPAPAASTSKPRSCGTGDCPTILNELPRFYRVWFWHMGAGFCHLNVKAAQLRHRRLNLSDQAPRVLRASVLASRAPSSATSTSKSRGCATGEIFWKLVSASCYLILQRFGAASRLPAHATPNVNITQLRHRCVF